MNNLEWLLQDLTYNTKFEFLEEAKAEELKKIAEKRGIKLPAHDLAVFKGRYAYVDRANKNKCTLPKEEVEKALDTLVGKAIDFDHFRKRVVGYWIDAELDKDEIIAYGIFFKGNFREDYTTVKELMERDVLSISFEAWGDREMKEDGSYDLKDIEFAGGALLLKESPAFPGSEVLEMAKNRVLEFAKVMTKPESFIHTGEDKAKDRIPDSTDILSGLTEEARFYLWDLAGIVKAISEVDCLSCKEKGYNDIIGLDFVENKAKVKCLNCEAMMEIDLTPSAKLTKKGRKIKKMKELEAVKASLEDIEQFATDFVGDDEALSIAIEDTFEESKKLTYKERQNINDDMFAVVVTVKNKKTGEPRKIRMFPIHDPAHVRNALARLGQPGPKATLQKLGVSVETVKNKILKRARQLNMKDLLERHKKGSVEELVQEFAKTTIQRELTKEELEKAYSLVDLKGKSKADSPSLQDPKGQSTADNPSLQNAQITEDELKAIIKEVAGVKEESKEAVEISKLKEDLKAKDTEIATLKAELDKAIIKIKEFETEKAKAEEVKRAELIKSRRDELGEKAKDMKDEDILDEKTYKIAKLEKENAELKAGKKTDPAAPAPDLTKGADDKTVQTEEAKSRKKVDELAFGPNSTENKE
jgi:hypothetical protein